MKPITEECQKTHTPCPTSYLGWHEWAEKMSKTHVQEKCPHCGLLGVWREKEPGVDYYEEHPEGYSDLRHAPDCEGIPDCCCRSSEYWDMWKFNAIHDKRELFDLVRDLVREFEVDFKFITSREKIHKAGAVEIRELLQRANSVLLREYRLTDIERRALDIIASASPSGYVPENDKDRLLEWAWRSYQEGQISADHTDKQVFKGVVGNLMDVIAGT